MTKLVSILQKLSQGSVESVQDGQAFCDIDQYLHIHRDIEDVLCAKMDEIRQEGGGIVFLVGSAGDGKSHLISSVRSRPEYADFYFHNDATESYSPTKTAVDTLRDVLIDFADDNIDSTNSKMVLAINLGKLIAFYDDSRVKSVYSRMIEYLSPLVCDEAICEENANRFKLIQFANQHIYEFDKESDAAYPVDSCFLRELIHRITVPEESNPFYTAYKASIPRDLERTDPVVINYQLLSIPVVQDCIVKMVIEAVIRFQLMVTPRDFQDFIYSILVYENLDKYTDSNHLVEALLPTMLFEGTRCKIQQYLVRLDPLRYSSTSHDKDLAALFTSTQIPNGFIDEAGIEEAAPSLLPRIKQMYGSSPKTIARSSRFLFRLKHILAYHSECDEYRSFLHTLRGFYNKDGQEIQRLFQLIETVVPRHYGSYHSPANSVPLNIQSSEYRLFANINIEPERYDCEYHSKNHFSLIIRLTWSKDDRRTVSLNIDYQLYEYLLNLENGRLALNFESNKNMAFSHFVHQLVAVSKSQTDVIIMTSDNVKHIVSKQFDVIRYKLC